MSKEKKIVDEIVEKMADYEANMSSFMSEVGEWADLYKVKPPKRQSDTFSNPRQTEFYRAATATGILLYRMMTSADPFFDIRSVDMNADYGKIHDLKHIWKTQLKYSNYRRNLLRACHFIPVFGTVICQEDYRVIGVSPFGRKIPTTVMTPRVMDQVAFDRSCTNFDEAEWVATADITSSSELKKLAGEAKTINAPWNPKALEAAADLKEEKATINEYTLERIRRSGFTEDEAISGKKKELVMYYGKLDAMGDNVEYVCGVVNRRILVRFHANNFQHGRRPFRVARWQDFDNPLGYGLGSLLSHQHKMMDGNRQRQIDLFTMAAYNMWQRKKNSVSDDDAIIGPLRFVDVDEVGDIAPIVPNIGAGDGLLRLDEFLKQEFRAASGASDTLQAIAADVSATATSLAQNEALRTLSVRAEIAADSLVREHLENLHWNNVQNIKAPLTIATAMGARRVYPADLRIDVEIEAKTTTDKDYQPKRLEKLINLVQILTSTKSQHPDQMQISILPLIKEIAYMLEVNPSEVILPPQMMGAPGMGMPGMAPAAPSVGAGDLLGLAASTAPGSEGPGGLSVVDTPVGPTTIS